MNQEQFEEFIGVTIPCALYHVEKTDINEHGTRLDESILIDLLYNNPQALKFRNLGWYYDKFIRQYDAIIEETQQEKLDKSLKAFSESLSEMSKEELDNFLPEPEIPKGWIDIEEHLPKCLAIDFITKGYSEYTAKDKDGNEFETTVTDHGMWYHMAKDAGITHWLNK